MARKFTDATRRTITPATATAHNIPATGYDKSAIEKWHAAIIAQPRTVANGYTAEYVSMHAVSKMPSGSCQCGCGAVVAGMFKQGHDATRYSVLGRSWRAGNLEAAFEMVFMRKIADLQSLVNDRKGRTKGESAATLADMMPAIPAAPEKPQE